MTFDLHVDATNLNAQILKNVSASKILNNMPTQEALVLCMQHLHNSKKCTPITFFCILASSEFKLLSCFLDIGLNGGEGSS